MDILGNSARLESPDRDDPSEEEIQNSKSDGESFSIPSLPMPQLMEDIYGAWKYEEETLNVIDEWRVAVNNVKDGNSCFSASKS
jgi:hypothetical protein